MQKRRNLFEERGAVCFERLLACFCPELIWPFYFSPLETSSDVTAFEGKV